MSESHPEALDIRDVVARIDHNLAESQKLYAEQSKLFAEHRKLSAEAAKLERERFLAPVLALVATLGAIAAVAPAILRARGAH